MTYLDSNGSSGDVVERAGWADRWIQDLVAVSTSAGFCATIEIDMTRSLEILESLRTQGTKITPLHLFARAAAVVLARRQELHQLVFGGVRLQPRRVDIGISVASSQALAPVLVVRNACQKSLEEIAVEVQERAPAIGEEGRNTFHTFNKWGWVIPFRWLRRTLLRLVLRQPGAVRKQAGTFQVTCLPETDLCMPLRFGTNVAFGLGRVRHCAVAVEDQVEARPTVFATCSADHAVWDGAAASRFLEDFKEVLEGGRDL